MQHTVTRLLRSVLDHVQCVYTKAIECALYYISSALLTKTHVISRVESNSPFN